MEPNYSPCCFVLAATLWIGSGVFGRTDPEEAAIRQAARAAQPPLQGRRARCARGDACHAAVVAVRPHRGRRPGQRRGPHHRLDRRAQGHAAATHVKQGDVIAVALRRGARGAGRAGRAPWCRKRQTELDAKLQLIKRGIVAANRQESARGDLRKPPRRRSPWPRPSASAASSARRSSGIVSDVPVHHRPGDAARMAWSRRSSRSIRCWRWSRSPSGSSRGVKVGDRAVVRLVTGADRARARSASSRRRRASRPRTYRVDVELPNADGAIPDGITAEVAFKLAARRRRPRPALGADLLADGDARRARGRCGRTWCASCRSRSSRMPAGSVWVGRPDRQRSVIVQGQDFVQGWPDGGRRSTNRCRRRNRSSKS